MFSALARRPAHGACLIEVGHVSCGQLWALTGERKTWYLHIELLAILMTLEGEAEMIENIVREGQLGPSKPQ